MPNNDPQLSLDNLSSSTHTSMIAPGDPGVKIINRLDFSERGKYLAWNKIRAWQNVVQPGYRRCFWNWKRCRFRDRMLWWFADTRPKNTYLLEANMKNWRCIKTTLSDLGRI